MEGKELSDEVQVAQMQVAHERKVIEAFNETPEENVASVTLEVGGIEHTILIHDEDYPQLYALLCKINDAENERLGKLLNEIEKRSYSMTLDEMKKIPAEIVNNAKDDPMLLEKLSDVVEKRKRGGSMKLETMKQICALSKCNVTESETAITFKFPDVEVIVNREFELGQTEAALFVMRGWLLPLREVFDWDLDHEKDGGENDKQAE